MGVSTRSCMASRRQPTGDGWRTLKRYEPAEVSAGTRHRSREPLRIVDELLDWVGHSPETLEAMRARLDSLQQEGAGQIED